MVFLWFSFCQRVYVSSSYHKPWKSPGFSVGIRQLHNFVIAWPDLGEKLDSTTSCANLCHDSLPRSSMIALGPATKKWFNSESAMDIKLIIFFFGVYPTYNWCPKSAGLSYITPETKEKLDTIIGVVVLLNSLTMVMELECEGAMGSSKKWRIQRLHEISGFNRGPQPHHTTSHHRLWGFQGSKWSNNSCSGWRIALKPLNIANFWVDFAMKHADFPYFVYQRVFRIQQAYMIDVTAFPGRKLTCTAFYLVWKTLFPGHVPLNIFEQIQLYDTTVYFYRYAYVNR